MSEFASASQPTSGGNEMVAEDTGAPAAVEVAADMISVWVYGLLRGFSVHPE